MFGYVTVYKPELKMKDFYRYKGYYCGLCKVLKERHGRLGQMTLTYDMTFLIVLLTSLYEKELTHEKNRCIVHPLKEHDMLFNEITEYAADMNIAMTYFHLVDDWEDEKSKAALVGIRALRNSYLKIEAKYPEKCRKIKTCLRRLSACEKRGEDHIDLPARCFGELMAELFVYRKDVWEKTLRRLGFYLGKYIYILDAYDDLEEDVEKGNYNPLKSIREAEDFDKKCEQMLTLVLGECSSAFEKLPCLLDVDILRNILYVGVWNKFDEKQKREEKGKKE